jgi:branched-chain amino acid transport system permease protein
MFEIFGIPSQALFGQLLLGLINGSFYALLSLGLAVIFGMLNIINFTHGAQYMMGAFTAYLVLTFSGLGYWPALIVAPIVVGIFGVLLERNLISQLNNANKERIVVLVASTAFLLILNHFFAGRWRLEPVAAFAAAIVVSFAIAEIFAWLRRSEYIAEPLDHLYGLLLTFGLALIIEGLARNKYGSAGLPYALPDSLRGGQNLGFMFLPNYRAWVIFASLAICLSTWFVIERTRLGAYLRAATENPTLVRAFGINVPRMITLTYGFGVALAALAGVMAAPIYNVSPQMGSDLIIVVFAVVVIGGMGSIMGAIVTGFGLGIIEGLTKVFFPEASNTVIFVIMAIVLLIRPAGLFGRTA